MSKWNIHRAPCGCAYSDGGSRVYCAEAIRLDGLQTRAGWNWALALRRAEQAQQHEQQVREGADQPALEAR